MVPCESAWLLPKTKRKKAMETAALCKPIQRSADLLRIPGTWVLTGLGKLLAVLGSFPQFRTASTTASHTSFWRFLECQSIEATLTQNGHLTHHEIPSVASLRPGGHFPRIGWPVSPEYALYSRSCSNTIRTARSLTSGEYLLRLPMTPSSQEMESPEIPGRFRLTDDDWPLTPLESPPGASIIRKPK